MHRHGLFCLLLVLAACGGSNPTPDTGAPVITVDEAIRAYTAGAAHASFQEREKGTIAAGMLADLT